MSTTPNTEALQAAVQEQVTDLLNNNIHAVSEKLLAADKGKGSFSVKVSLALVRGKALVTSKLSFSEKWADETEVQSVDFVDPDPDQIKIKEVAE